jgi:PAS domain S-box-containing protein
MLNELGQDREVQSLREKISELEERNSNLQRLERASKEKVATFEALLRASRDGIVLTRPDRTITRVVCPIVGNTGSTSVGMTLDVFIHPEDNAVIRECYRRLIEDRELVATYRVRLIKADGSLIWVGGTVTDMLDEPAVQAFVLNYRDITDRKRHELAMLELDALVESTSFAIFAKDRDGFILSWNPGAERIYGYTAGEIVGAHIRRLVPVELQEEERLSRAAVLEVREPLLEFRTIRIRRDGTHIPIGLVLAPLIEEDQLRGIAHLSHILNGES